jgi:hypothetical protein
LHPTLQVEPDAAKDIHTQRLERRLVAWTLVLIRLLPIQAHPDVTNKSGINGLNRQ